MTVTAQRRTEYTDVLASTETWVGTRSDIRALGLAGSWARDEARMSSDVDLVVLTNEVELYVADPDWVPLATGQDGRIVRTQPWVLSWSAESSCPQASSSSTALHP